MDSHLKIDNGDDDNDDDGYDEDNDDGAINTTLRVVRVLMVLADKATNAMLGATAAMGSDMQTL